MRRYAAGALAIALGVALAGCGDDQPGEADPSPTPTSASSSSPEEADTTSPSTTPTEGDGPATGSLDWQSVPGSIDDTVTVSGRWRLTLAEGGETATLDGPKPRDFEAPGGYQFSHALIDGDHAAVVAEHQQARRPNVVTVVDLASGSVTEGDVPAGVGGDWALGSGLLAGTLSRGREYCVATTDLLSGRSGVGPCVEPRHGISNLTLTPAGLAAMTFDDSRPSCRTLNRVTDDGFVPLPGVEACHGWEAVVTETSAVWGVVSRERRVEEAEYFVDTGTGPTPLGPGTTGTLTWCGEAAYVVRDPQRGSDPARLLRIDPAAGTTEVVYESPGTGRAFLSAPRCGGTDLTITAYSAQGDEQVTAQLG